MNHAISLLRQRSYRWIVFLLMVAGWCDAADYVFETDAARLALSPQATVVSLTDKAEKQEWLRAGKGSGAAAFAIAHRNGRSWAATSLKRDGDRFEIDFGRSGIEADARITARRDYILFELIDARGGAIDDITFAQLPVRPAPHASGMLNVKWDDKFAVCLMGLDAKVHAGFGPGAALRCEATSEFGLAGHKAALIAVPTSRFNQVMQEVETDFKIPHATIGGEWAKTSEAIRRGYLFVDLTEKNADEIIRLAKLGGFGSILIYSGVWSKSNGSYLINTANYPEGEASLEAVVDKCHAAGLKVGIHTLTSFVAKNDPLVRPKPDAR
ncbi:MAG TPA: hypothetical protein VHH88_13210, partial [Verrucomicrobiae bacterium]|nr:hypothetical protein [Verrucomicrobiae bacterium]